MRRTLFNRLSRILPFTATILASVLVTVAFAQTGVGGRFFTGPGNSRNHEIGADGVTYLQISPSGVVTTENSAVLNLEDDNLSVDSRTQTSTGTLTYPNLAGNTNMGVVVAATCKMAAADGHTGAAGTSTCTIELPAASVLIDIQVQTTVLWDSGTSATLLVGDDDDPNGWFDSTSVKATDMLVGEIFSALHGDLWGGLNGAYLVAATGRRGRVTAGVDSGNYLGAATEVIATITTVGATTVGTTYITVIYTQPTQLAAVYAAT